MPTDRWGIPFWYPTAKTAGNTGTGSGFFWEQPNNFRDAENVGFLRLGKETDDCELIDLATGTWEFPYLTDGDGLSMSGPTGHHSGGETHGCQGFTYMVDGSFETGGAPTFRFRKETYHVQYNTDPATGTWTSPDATEVTSTQWKGMGWVSYNKENSSAPGGISRVLEVWWNDNPTANIANWKMIKRTEDKGEGISNWGVPATCDGEDYQIGTWSNIQFRIKSSASDFSLHPLIPEFNEGDNIHSIGGEDMSFSDSAARGYGKRADMPNNIEMKCLFKWNAGGAGKCHFKNISLREIDPTLSFDDTPENPPPTEEPGGTSTIFTSFKFMQDINNYRSSACAGTGTGGGAGTGNTIFWTTSANSDTELSNSTTFENRTRVVEIVKKSSSPWAGKLIEQLDVPLKKIGTPTTPNISAKIWSSGGTVRYTSPTTIDPSTLTTSFVKRTFDFGSNTHVLVVGDRVGVEWTGTSSTNYVLAGWQGGSIGTSSIYANYENGLWDEKSTRDWAVDAWE